MLEIILETARKSDKNVLIEGVHGIGKSQRVKKYAFQKDIRSGLNKNYAFITYIYQKCYHK